jgi:hypothetical protein
MPKAKTIKPKLEEPPKIIGVKIPFCFIKIICSIIILVSLVFASWFAINGDIVFHTDIARDFLLMEDVVRNKPITLIGPRSGGIPGVFHGPLWTYLNIPAFIIGNGNPAVIGWFWVILFAMNVFIVYKVGQKMISTEVGWIAAAITSIITAFSVPGFFNPFGAVMFTPVFMYFLFKYVKTNNIKDLLWSLFTLGIVIQFQMAFGVPVLVLFVPFLFYLIIRNKKFLHIFSLLILLIPLSTFILFDLKHQFLQTKSVMNYLTGKENTGKLDRKIGDLFRERINSIVHIGPSFIAKDNSILFYIVLAMLGFSLFKLFKEKKEKDTRLFFLLFIYFYVGYWLMTVLYKGTIWGYYYWPFLGLSALFFAAFSRFINKWLFYILLIVFVVFNFNTEISGNFKSVAYFGGDNSSWRFHEKVAKLIYEDAPAEFGYYIFTADQFGYSSRYGMNFVQTQYKNKKAFSYEKKQTTYLLIFPSDNPTINDDWWKEEKVKIKRPADKVFTFDGSNMRIEKYVLTPDEVADKSDENLIHTLIFR